MLYEYENISHVELNLEPSSTYKLPYSFYGTGHVIYQGSLYYHAHDLSNMVFRYCLGLKKIVANLTLNLLRNETNPKLCRV